MMAMQTISGSAPATCFKDQTGTPSIAVPHRVSSLSPNAATRRPSRCISRYMAIPACPVPNITHPFIRLLSVFLSALAGSAVAVAEGAGPADIISDELQLIAVHIGISVLHRVAAP